MAGKKPVKDHELPVGWAKYGVETEDDLNVMEALLKNVDRKQHSCKRQYIRHSAGGDGVRKAVTGYTCVWDLEKADVKEGDGFKNWKKLRCG